MKIKQIEVVGGFLDGVKIPFNGALNTIIGPRGSGKTSIVELIRYCLGISPLVSRPPGVAVRQALSVLADGKVTVTIEHGGEEFVVSRTAGFAPSATDLFPAPVILASTEIEQIGIEPSSRLGLLDSFVESQDTVSAEQRLISELSTVSVRVQSLFAEVDELRGSVESHPELDEQLSEARAEQGRLQNVGPALEAERAKLKQFGVEENQLQSERTELNRVEVAIAKQIEILRSVSLAEINFTISDRLAQANSELAASRVAVREALTRLSLASEMVQTARGDIDILALTLADAMRPLRAKLNEYVAGLGTLTSRLQQLEQAAIRRQLARERILSLESETASLRTYRETVLVQLEAIRHARFLSRDRAAIKLTKALGPRIRVTVTRSGALDVYEAEIAELLRGSGLHKSLFAELAKKISPRELVTFVENADVSGLRIAAGINAERARKAIDYLRARDCSSLLVLNVEDEVRFWLLDGTIDKASDRISMGQRCTIVLPIIMEQLDVPLILDQPEDNLDNAFIVQTLVWAIQQRKKIDQLIVATHNPNIPVLGLAENVIVLGSDGRTGFVRCSGSVDDPEIVEAITTLMEGGKEAFERRAAFYREHAFAADA